MSIRNDFLPTRLRPPRRSNFLPGDIRKRSRSFAFDSSLRRRNGREKKLKRTSRMGKHPSRTADEKETRWIRRNGVSDCFREGRKSAESIDEAIPIYPPSRPCLLRFETMASSPRRSRFATARRKEKPRSPLVPLMSRLIHRTEGKKTDRERSSRRNPLTDQR